MVVIAVIFLKSILDRQGAMVFCKEFSPLNLWNDSVSQNCLAPYRCHAHCGRFLLAIVRYPKLFASQAVKHNRYQHHRKRKEDQLFPMNRIRAQRTRPSTLSRSRSKQGPETPTVKEDVPRLQLKRASADAAHRFTGPSSGCCYKR